MAKKSIINREMRRKYPTQVRHRCETLWSPAWLYSPIWSVPHLLPRISAAGQDPRRDEVILVAGLEVVR